MSDDKTCKCLTEAAQSSHSAVAIFNTHLEAEDAINDLRKAGYNMKKLSIIGKDLHAEEHVVGYYNTGDRIGYWGKLGAFWGGLWGLLFGSAFLLVPGIGPVVAGGPIVGLIVGGLEGAVVFGGISAIGAALYGIGIPKDSILKYESTLKSDRFLVIAHGTTGEIAQARDVLQSSRAMETNVHRAARQ